MEDNGLFVVHLHHGDKFIGKMAISPQSNSLPFKPGDDLRIATLSGPSDRCFPLVVLHTTANEGVLFKLEPVEYPTVSAESKELESVHSTCLKELKTVVILLAGGMELHLAPMIAVRRQRPCFWGFLMSPGLYSSCLTMLNLRCLALVFDLDETLIVANTMRSFEDRIDVLGSKLKAETDSQKLSGMSAELKRYIQDRALLKQYIDDDRVWDNTVEKFVNAQVEVVPPAVEGGLPRMRPVVRLQDRNMIFTRINPTIRDTSVLVRLRPAWEELRNYLTHKGRKRFEVFVCTMSEKEYALEMWRLLDPDSQLLSAKEMVERVVCVKSGSKKSLADVFSSGNCHPKMAMVIDDRLKVWEDRDQPQVHVVPAFAPYYAPQAETNSLVPVLCVARNVACNVRGGFFRDLDEGLARKLAEVDFDAEVSTLPQPPVVSNYMTVEEELGMAMEAANGNKDFPDGMTDSEMEKKLSEPFKSEGMASNSASLQSTAVENESLKPKLHPSKQPALPVSIPPTVLRPQTLFAEPPLSEKPEPPSPRVSSELPSMKTSTVAPPAALRLFEPSLQCSPVREEGEVQESELDPDTRRRLLILQHGQDTQRMHNPQEKPESSFPPQGQSLRVTIPPSAPAGGWLGAEEEMSPRQVSRTSSGLILEPESPSFGKQQPFRPFFGGPDVPGSDTIPKEQRSDAVFAGLGFPETEGSMISNNSNPPPRDIQMRPHPGNNAANPVAVLKEIALKCNTKLEFRSLVNTTKELLFSVEVLFGGERVGEGIGRTSKEAQHKAADKSLRYMANQFISHPTHAINTLGQGRLMTEPAQRWNSRDPRFSAGLGPVPAPDVDMPAATVTGQSKFLDFQNVVEPNIANNPVAVLKGYCTMEGINVVFRDASLGLEAQPQESFCQVEVAGRVMGKGSARSWEEAKQLAAEDALRSLKLGPQPSPRGPPKRMNAPRSPSLQANKRVRSGDVPRGLQRMPSPRTLSPRRF